MKIESVSFIGLSFFLTASILGVHFSAITWEHDFEFSLFLKIEEDFICDFCTIM